MGDFTATAGWVPPKPRRPVRQTAVLLIKVAAAVAIVVYLARTQRLGISRLSEVLRHPLEVATLLFLLLLLAQILARRWQLLLTSQGYRCRFWDVLSLTFVAIFFDSLLPGGTSDLVRGYYFDRKFQPQDRLRAASTVVVDRFLGVMALLLLALAALSLQGHPDDRGPWPALRLTVSLFGVVFLLGFLFLCGSTDVGRGWLARAAGRWRFGSVCLNIFDALRGYRHCKGALIKAVCLSLLAHLIVIGCFGLLGVWMGENRLTLVDYLFVVPVGLVVAQIPISPGGIGVGHVGFYSLFALSGSRLGGDVFSLYIVLHFLSSLPGLVCFLFLRRSAPVRTPPLADHVIAQDQEELICR
jgi:hypothetical protein